MPLTLEIRENVILQKELLFGIGKGVGQLKTEEIVIPRGAGRGRDKKNRRFREQKGCFAHLRLGQ
jgi:hypothetical protein